MNTSQFSGKMKVAFASLFSTIVLVFLDQWTKQLAVRALSETSSIPLIDGVLEFFYVENRGAAFGIFQNATLIFTGIAVIAVLAIIYLLLKIPTGKYYIPLRIALVMIASGAIGNMIDRIQLTYVRDFIYFSLIDFPVFNVADIYVTVAVFVLIILILFVYKDEDLDFWKKS